MRLFYGLLGLVVLFAQAPYSLAQEDKPLTLQHALEQAYQFNPSLLTTRHDIDIAEALVTQAHVLPNPELAGLTEGLEKGRRTTTIQINQVFELGGKRSSRINAAELDQQIALAELNKQRSDVRAQVIGLFFEVLNSQERVQLADASYKLATQISSVVKRRVAAGRLSPIEATRSKVAELTIKTELNQAKTELTLAKTRLLAMWGASNATFTEVVKPTLDEIISAELVYDDLPLLQTRLENSPQLIHAQLTVERQQAQEAIERSRQVGDLTFSIGRKRDEQAGISQTVLGVSVPIPLFDRNQGNVLGALRKTDKARDELNVIRQQLNNELTQAYQRYQLAEGELAMLQVDILPQAQSAVTATIKGFDFGKFNFLDVIQAQSTLFQTKLQYLKTQADFYRSMADIERIVGTIK